LEAIATLLRYFILDEAWRSRIGTFGGSPQRIEELLTLAGDHRLSVNLSGQVVLSDEMDDAVEVWAMAHTFLASLHSWVMTDGPYMRSGHKVEGKKPDAQIGDRSEQSRPL
jgi:hypothetical protein